MANLQCNGDIDDLIYTQRKLQYNWINSNCPGAMQLLSNAIIKRRNSEATSRELQGENVSAIWRQPQELCQSVHSVIDSEHSISVID